MRATWPLSGALGAPPELGRMLGGMLESRLGEVEELRSKLGEREDAYGAYEILNGATKFFADALMRHEAVEAGGLGATSPVSVLA